MAPFDEVCRGQAPRDVMTTPGDIPGMLDILETPVWEDLEREPVKTQVLELECRHRDLKVDTSTIAGLKNSKGETMGKVMGLFADKDFPKGGYIAPYWGCLLSLSQQEDLYPVGSGVTMERGIEFDKLHEASAHVVELCLEGSSACAATYANHSKVKQNASIIEVLDSRYREEWIKLVSTATPSEALAYGNMKFLKAKKSIKKGEEIFINYGRDYFRLIEEIDFPPE